MASIIRSALAISVLLVVFENASSAILKVPKCRLHTDHFGGGGIMSQLATNLPYRSSNNDTLHVTEVLVAIEENKGESDHCEIVLKEEGGHIKQVNRLKEGEEVPVGKWHFVTYHHRATRSEHFVYVKYISDGGDFKIPLGRKELIFDRGKNVTFFSVDEQDEYDDEGLVAVGQDGLGTLNTTESMRACLDFAAFKNSTDYLSCGGVRYASSNEKELIAPGVCSVVNVNDTLDAVSVSVTHNGSAGRYDSYVVVCSAVGVLPYEISQRFTATGFLQEPKEHLDIVLGLSALTLGLLFCLSVLASAYFICPSRGMLCLYSDRYAFLAPKSRRHPISSCTSSVVRCSRFPISEEGTVMSELANGYNDSVFGDDDDEGDGDNAGSGENNLRAGLTPAKRLASEREAQFWPRYCAQIK